VFKITPGGKLTTLYSFDNVHGTYPSGGLTLGSDGNLYGTTTGGGGAGYPFAGLVQATDGNFYGTTTDGGTSSYGTLFNITSKGGYSVLHNFDPATGSTPEVTLIQSTSGILYGDTYGGGTGYGVFYSWTDASLPAFVSLLPYSGKVGKITAILGQGFSSSSIVKFDGVRATSVKRTGTTFLSATVPAGALTGSVTVTTGSTTLTSNKTFRVTPQIISFSPPNGPVGTPATIKGVSVTQTTKVTFGGVKATTFSVNSDMQVTATVPTGAMTGHIATMTLGGTAVSSGIFAARRPNLDDGQIRGG